MNRDLVDISMHALPWKPQSTVHMLTPVHRTLVKLALWVESSYRPILRDYLPPLSALPRSSIALEDPTKFDAASFFRQRILQRRITEVPPEHLMLAASNTLDKLSEASHILRPLLYGTGHGQVLCSFVVEDDAWQGGRGKVAAVAFGVVPRLSQALQSFLLSIIPISVSI